MTFRNSTPRLTIPRPSIIFSLLHTQYIHPPPRSYPHHDPPHHSTPLSPGPGGYSGLPCGPKSSSPLSPVRCVGFVSVRGCFGSPIPSGSEGDFVPGPPCFCQSSHEPRYSPTFVYLSFASVKLPTAPTRCRLTQPVSQFRQPHYSSPPLYKKTLPPSPLAVSQTQTYP
jgi:hypothetical protein